MAAASNAQVQQWVNERQRPHCELIRKLYLLTTDDKNSIDDIYQNVNGATTWTDTRADAPPHLLTKDDVLSYNSFITAFIAFIEGSPDYPAVLDSCVRGPELA